MPELAAAALLLFTFLPLLKDNATWDWLLGQESSSLTAAAAAAGDDNSDAAALDPAQSSQNGTAASADAAAATGVSTLPGVLTPSEIALLLEAHDAIGTEAPQRQATQTLNHQHLTPGLSALADLWQRLTATAAAPASAGSSAATAKTGAHATTTAKPAVTSLLRSSTPLRANELQPLQVQAPHLVIPRIKRSHPSWTYGVTGGVSILQVVSPADQTFETGRRSRTLAVPQIGMQATYNLKSRLRLGMATSILSATYDPGLPEVALDGSSDPRRYGYTEDFRFISLDLLRVHADMRYGLKARPKKLQVWGKLGLGSHFVLHTTYDVQRETTTARATQVPVETYDHLNTGDNNFAARPAEPLLSKNAPSDVKQLPNGLLQGGKLRDNRWLFGRVGVEAEWKAGSRLNVFGSLDFDAGIPATRGFGPNRDRFFALGAEVGARLSL